MATITLRMRIQIKPAINFLVIDCFLRSLIQNTERFSSLSYNSVQCVQRLPVILSDQWPDSHPVISSSNWAVCTFKCCRFCDFPPLPMKGCRLWLHQCVLIDSCADAEMRSDMAFPRGWWWWWRWSVSASRRTGLGGSDSLLLQASRSGVLLLLSPPSSRVLLEWAPSPKLCLRRELPKGPSDTLDKTLQYTKRHLRSFIANLGRTHTCTQFAYGHVWHQHKCQCCFIYCFFFWCDFRV